MEDSTLMLVTRANLFLYFDYSKDLFGPLKYLKTLDEGVPLLRNCSSADIAIISLLFNISLNLAISVYSLLSQIIERSI